ncbi:MAG: dTMP kinase [Desulfobacterales bacterium]|nr:dTMP kinase [Desulfobacterales bacterium]
MALKTNHWPGRLIAFEGIDGTGKSTQVRLLAEELIRRGHRVVMTREPTDGPFGQRIRRLYSDRNSVSRQEEMELFVADRRQHVDEVILPALGDGKVVITDRYYYSTAAYQGAAGLDPEEIIRRNEEFAPRPDLVLLLELDPAQGIDRIRNSRNEELNAFEQEESLARVATVFNRLQGDHIQRLDASRSVAGVHDEVLQQVEALFKG